MKTTVTKTLSVIAWEWGVAGDGQKGEITKEPEETCGSDGYVHYFDCGGGFKGIYKTYHIVYFKYVVVYCLPSISQ